MNVYLLIDENSPELSIENGAYNVIGVYSDRGQVLQRLESRIKEEKAENYICMERYEDDKSVNLYFYYNGDEENPCWFVARMVELKLQ